MHPSKDTDIFQEDEFIEGHTEFFTALQYRNIFNLNQIFKTVVNETLSLRYWTLFDRFMIDACQKDLAPAIFKLSLIPGSLRKKMPVLVSSAHP